MPTATRQGPLDPLAGLMRKMGKMSLTSKRKVTATADDLTKMLGKLSISKTLKRKHATRRKKTRFTARKTHKTPKPTGNEMDLSGGRRRRGRRRSIRRK
jgi:hypothetical protein